MPRNDIQISLTLKSINMKKIILALSIALSLIGCTTDSIENQTEATANSDLFSKTVSSKSVITTTTIPSSDYTLSPYQSCEIDCIAKESPVYFEKTAEQTVSWGGPNNNKFSKTIYIKYFNTKTHFVLQAISTEGFSDLIINGNPSGISAAANTWGTYSYLLSENWKACDIESLNLQVAGNGPQGVFAVNYGLVGLCPEACENELTGKAISCDGTREAEYTFTSKEDITDLKIQGGLTNFTGSDAVVTVTGGNLTVSQKTPGGSSNRVITVVGSVTACETIKIHITWNSTNTGGTITGDWSASGIGIEVPIVEGLTCN